MGAAVTLAAALTKSGGYMPPTDPKRTFEPHPTKDRSGWKAVGAVPHQAVRCLNR